MVLMVMLMCRLCDILPGLMVVKISEYSKEDTAAMKLYISN